jgi:hypothetical protein
MENFSLPVGQAIRACCDVVRTVSIAWQALVPGGAGHRLGGFSGAEFLETMVTCGYY